MLADVDTGTTVALFSMLGVILAAVFSSTIPAWLASKRAKRNEDTIGAKNGHGTVTEMLGKLLDRHARTDERIARLEERSLGVGEALARLDGRVDKLESPQIVVVPPAAVEGPAEPLPIEGGGIVGRRSE